MLFPWKRNVSLYVASQWCMKTARRLEYDYAKHKFSYLHGFAVFWCGISFHLDYKIRYSAIYCELEFQNLISETWTGDVPGLGYACIPNPSGRQAGGNAATFEFQHIDFAGLATFRLAGVKALGDCFVLELLQYYSFETQIWGDAARVFRASLPSTLSGRLQRPRMVQGNALQIRALIEHYF